MRGVDKGSFSSVNTAGAADKLTRSPGDINTRQSHCNNLHSTAVHNSDNAAREAFGGKGGDRTEVKREIRNFLLEENKKPN